jgi:UDP-N-acetylmuramoyl-tripeptide--D-alanyl-D-alanine ligase
MPKGIIFRIDENGKSLPVVIEGVFGRNHVYASLAAITLAFELKLNIINAIDALKSYDISPGRMKLLRGINGSLIIDDTYNSSPSACRAALTTLGAVETHGRKIAVLGDMLELGKHTEEAHKNIGKIAGDILKGSHDVLIVIGLRAQAIKIGASDIGMNKENIFQFTDSYKTGDFLKNLIQKDDLVLIKGSQSMRMERVVEAVLLDKENKNELLVRQDEEWQKKK